MIKREDYAKVIHKILKRSIAFEAAKGALPSPAESQQIADEEWDAYAAAEDLAERDTHDEWRELGAGRAVRVF